MTTREAPRPDGTARRLGALLLGAASVIALALAAPIETAAAPTVSGFILDSGVGEKLGGGELIQGETSTMVGALASGRYQVTGDDIFGKPWTFSFRSSSAPTLPIGHYTSSTGTITIAQGAKTCTVGSDVFDVVQAPVVNGSDRITAFAVDFHGNCISGGPIYGSIRIGSSSPLSLLRVTSSLAFEDTVVGETSVVQEIQVLGVTDDSIQLGAAALSGTHPDQFEIVEDGCAGVEIRFEDECAIRVRFAPTTTTDKQATVVLPNDALAGDRLTKLTGDGLSPLTLLPSSLVLDAREDDPVSGTDWYIDPAAMTGQGGPRLVDLWVGQWFIRVAAPSDGGDLHVGTYPELAYSSTAETIGFQISRSGAGCPGPTGSVGGTVTILEAPVFDTDGRLLQFSADFEQYCLNGPGILRGWIRFHSSIPVPKWVAPAFDLQISDTAPQVGDTITITPVPANIDFFDVKRCQIILEGIVGPGPSDGARMQVASDDCAPWTFTVPDSPPGHYNVSGQVDFGDQPAVPEQHAGELTEGIEIVAGGSPVPFDSNYPVQSWAPADFQSDPTPTYGAPLTIPPPPGADGCRIYLLMGFESSWTEQRDGCDPWTIQLASPASDGDGFFIPTSAGRAFGWSGTSDWTNTEPTHPYVGARWGAMYRDRIEPMSGTGGTYASNLPAIFGGSSVGSVYYVDETTPSTWTPVVKGTAAGSCHFRGSDAVAPVSGSACGHGIIPVWPYASNGTWADSAQLRDGDGEVIGETSIELGYALHMSPLDLALGATSQLGADLEVGASTATGAPATYQVIVEEQDDPVASFSGVLSPGPGQNGDRVDVAAADLPMGTYRVTASFTDIKGESRTTSAMVDVVDTTGPAGTISINAGDPYTTARTVTVGVDAMDVSGVTDVAISNDGTHWTTSPYAPSIPWTVPSTDGTRKVWAKWRDGLGNWSAPKTDTIILDRVAPAVTSVTRAFRSSVPYGAGAILVRIGWTGTDSASGIGTYEIAQSTDGNTWQSLTAGLTSARSDRPLATGHDYQFRIRATDRAGHVGAWKYGSTFHLTKRENSSSKVKYSGTWKTSTSSVYSGGSARTSTKAGSKASLTAAARSIAFVSRVGPTRGKATIYIDGKKVKTIDLHAATAAGPTVVYAKSWTKTGKHTITVRVSGTSGHPSVVVDAFLVAD